VVATIAGRPPDVNVVCTGRDAPDALVEVADTVTEMRNVKHAYDTGVLAKKGIDY
jgi:ATP:corrinoid adenosyltransferase